MYCQNCGSKVTDGSLFCPACGVKLDSGNAAEETAQQTAEQTRSYEQPASQQTAAQAGSTMKPYNGYSIASLVLGILGFIFPIFICSILAIVFSGISAKNVGRRDGMATAGFILGIISLIFTIIVVIVAVVAVAAFGTAFSYLYW